MLINKQGEHLKKPDVSIFEYNLRRILGNDDLLMPENYIVFDLETTGVSPSVDSIWQIGMYPILGGKPTCDITAGDSIYLALPEEQLRKATFEIGRRRAKLLGKVHDPRETVDVLTDEAYHQAEAQFIAEVHEKGVDPVDGLRKFTELVQVFIDNKYYTAGQNYVKFDIPFVEFNCKRHCIDFTFPQEHLIDTAMLIKAAILRRRIMGNETSRAFYIRVAEEFAKGCYHALERFCIPYWDMETKYGIDTTKAHDAGYDCYITQLVIREIINDVYQFRRS